MLSITAAVAAATLLTGLGSAAAATAALDLGPLPEGCPAGEAITAQVRQTLDRDPFSADAARTLRVRWSPTETGLVADLAVVEGGVVRGARRLVSGPGECAALHRAVGLMLALAVDPLHLADPLPEGVTEVAPPPEPAEPEPPPEPVEPVEPAETPADPDTAATASDRIVVEPPRAFGPSVGLRGTWGVAPTLGAALRAGVDGRLGLLSYGGAVLGALPASTAFAGGEVSAALAAADAALGLRVVGLDVQALVFAGWQPTWGAGFGSDLTTHGPYLATGARVGAPLSIAGVALRPAVEVVRPLVQRRLTVSGEEAWRTPAINVAAGVDVVF